MVTLSRPQPLSQMSATGLAVPLPLAGAAAGGGIVALGFLLMPASLLEGAVSASGIPAILAAAEPPLGFTARIALALVFGGLTAGFAWFGLGVIARGRKVDATRLTAWLRRAKPASAAAPRPPLFANRDLGTPFLDVRAPVHLEPEERAVPADLDQPLAAFDPAALLAVPLAAPEPVAPLARPEPPQPRQQLFDPGDRFETFELTPLQREPAPSAPAAPRPSLRIADPAPPPAAPAPQPVVAPQTEATVHDLLARLERGVAARPAPEPAIRAGSVADALGDLRRLATGIH